MVRSFNSAAAFRLALVAAAAVSVTACGSRPKPNFSTQPTPGPGATQPSGPATPSQPGAVGQQVLPGSQQDFVINVGERVFFDYDQYDIRADAAPVLDAQAEWLRRYPNVRVRIEGNADERGTREYNLALGARRANAVRDYLTTRGVASSRISTISFGKEQPIDTADTEEAHQRNRNARTAIVDGAR